MDKISFSDLKIGDFVLTTNNQVGEVIALKSYAYLNDKIAKKAKRKDELTTEELKSFKFDNTRHNGIWYAVVTIAIEDKSKNKPTYFTENIDFIEIQKIIKDSDEKESIINKIRNIFKN